MAHSSAREEWADPSMPTVIPDIFCLLDTACRCDSAAWLFFYSGPLGNPGTGTFGAGQRAFPPVFITACSPARRPTPAKAAAGDPPRGDPDRVFPLASRPGLHARGPHRGPFGLGVHVVRGAMDQDAPAFARHLVDVVDLECDLVLRVRDPGPQVLSSGCPARCGTRWLPRAARS